MTRRKLIGYAQVRLPADGELYAACPMYTDNLPLLEKWLKDNWTSLANVKGPHAPKEAGSDHSVQTADDDG